MTSVGSRTRTGIGVGARVRVLERAAADLLRPGCPLCRDGFGFRLLILEHEEAEQPFRERCHACGREFGEDEGVRMVIRGESPGEVDIPKRVPDVQARVAGEFGVQAHTEQASTKQNRDAHDRYTKKPAATTRAQSRHEEHTPWAST